MLPILYSYRRCPYAIRARMALHYAGIAVETREVSLKQKPLHMLQASPKGTVPVLIFANNQVIDQSLEIMLWALQQHDTEGWLHVDQAQAGLLIAENDGSFKQNLDRYKYADRFPEHSAEYYRAQAELFLKKLEHLLQQNTFLLSRAISLADIAIFPFMRQFAAVDTRWFESTEYSKLKHWLHHLVESALFNSVMDKQPTYHDK